MASVYFGTPKTNHERTPMNRLCATSSLMVLTAVTLIGCDAASMERIADEAGIENRHASRLVQASDVKGTYENLDVNAVIFSYQSGAEGSTQFWELLEKNIDEEDWARLPATSEARRYQRASHRAGSPVPHSIEESRVFFDEKTDRVYVAWVVSGSQSKSESFAETREGKWADQEVWPQFDSIASLH